MNSILYSQDELAKAWEAGVKARPDAVNYPKPVEQTIADLVYENLCLKQTISELSRQ